MHERHREAWAVPHVAYFLGVRSVRSSPPLDVCNCNFQTVWRDLLRRIVDGEHDRTFPVASQRPVLVRKTIKTVVTENEMVEQPDAQQVSSFPQSWVSIRSVLKVSYSRH